MDDKEILAVAADQFYAEIRELVDGSINSTEPGAIFWVFLLDESKRLFPDDSVPHNLANRLRQDGENFVWDAEVKKVLPMVGAFRAALRAAVAKPALQPAVPAPPPAAGGG